MRHYVLFDLYGTLIDILTDEESDSFWKEFADVTKEIKEYTPSKLKKEYLKKCLELQKKVDEINIIDVFDYLFPNQDDLTLNLIEWKFRKISHVLIKPFRHVELLLKNLRNDGYKVYLLSNAQEAFTMPELKMFNLDKYFDDIFISSVYGVKKPNTAFFKMLLDKHKINYKEAIMVGNDYFCDIQPAVTLGLDGIYVETRTSPKQHGVEKIKGFHWKKIYKRIKSSR